MKNKHECTQKPALGKFFKKTDKKIFFDILFSLRNNDEQKKTALKNLYSFSS